MSATAQPVYSSSAVTKGHIVHFDVETPSFKTTRTVIHLPRICEVDTEGATQDNETMFSMLQFNYIEPHFGFVNEEMLAAVTALVDFTYVPFHPRIGIRIASSQDATTVILCLRNNVGIDEVCAALAAAIYDDVADVSWDYIPPRGMSALEREDRNAYNLED